MCAFVVLILALLPAYASTCELVLHTQASENVTRNFMSYVGQGQVTVVFFNIYIKKASAADTFELYQAAGANDTFLPWKWVWASSGGAFMLKLPLDYPVMSLGVLASCTRDMDVFLTTVPSGCTPATENITHYISRTLILNVTEQTGYSVNGFAEAGGGVCRSAYTGSHVTQNRKLIGYKCCAWHETSERWICDMDSSEGWKVTWFGPLLVVAWSYIILIIKCIAGYRQTKEHSVSTGKLVEQLKLHVIKEVARTSSRVPMADTPSALLSKYDKIRYMDILDIPRKLQLTISRVVRSFFLVLMFAGYYGYVTGSIVYYQSTAAVISEMDSTSEVGLNVFSHIGWIFAKKPLAIRYYGVCELVITCVIPVMLLYIYASQRPKHQAPSQVHPVGLQSDTSPPASNLTKLPPIIPQVSNEDFHEVAMMKYSENHTCLGKCLQSKGGKALNMIFSVIVLVYSVAIASVHLAYMAYFLLKGALLSMTVLATWLLPAALMLQYLRSVFMPLYTVYAHTRESYCEQVESDAPHLCVEQDGVAFIQRSLVEDFYHRYARQRIFDCVLRAMTAFTVLFILLVVLYSSGSQALQDNSSSIVGVNFVLLLPLLGRSMEPRPLPELEKRTLDRQIKHHIALKSTAKKQWQGVKEAAMKKKTTKEANVQETQGSVIGDKDESVSA